MMNPDVSENPGPLGSMFGRYRLMHRIGVGGMGEVFLARDERAGNVRACVVKKILPSLAANSHFVGRFRDEARVVLPLDHRNIARVYAMGDVDGEYFLAMEYIEGKTLSRFTRRLRERRLRLPPALALLLAERVCAGLAYAHNAKDESGRPLGLVHRDLSPANVCIAYHGEIKIIDFGAAYSRVKEELTAPCVVIGNLTYMAPEQAQKRIVDGRADVYSLGAILWELLAWTPLTSKGDPIERWHRAVKPKWEPLSSVAPELPADLDKVVQRALHVDRDGRYAFAGDFGQAIREVRHRHFPKASEAQLAELISSVFAQEKHAEVAALAEVLRGIPPSDEQTQVLAAFAPPTESDMEDVAVLEAEPDGLTRSSTVPLPVAELLAAGTPRGAVPEPSVEPPSATVAAPKKRWWPWYLLAFLLAGGAGFWGAWALIGAS